MSGKVNVKPNKKSKIKNFLKSGAFISGGIMTLIGIAGSLFVGDHYYDLGRSNVKIEAERKGFQDGLARGQREAQIANKKNLPDYIRQNYPGAMEAARAQGREEGYRTGLREGKKIGENTRAETEFRKGYDRGLSVGRSEGFQEGRETGFNEGKAAGFSEGVKKGREGLTWEINAEKNWNAYTARVNAVANIARELNQNKGNNNIEKKLEKQVSILLNNSDNLRKIYKSQADYFNGEMINLSKALKHKNYPEMRRLSILISGKAKSNGYLFIQGEKQISKIFSQMRKPG